MEDQPTDSQKIIDDATNTLGQAVPSVPPTQPESLVVPPKEQPQTPAPSKPMKKKGGKGMLIGMLLFFFLTLPVAVYYGFQQFTQTTESRSKAAPATTLYFNASTVSKQQGDTFSLDVTVDTGSNSITVADFTVNTDPTKIKITGITQGAFLTTVVVPGAFTDGKATMVLASPTGFPKSGIGVLATVTFQVIATDGTSEITLTGSKATAHDETKNVITGTTPAMVTIGSSDGNFMYICNTDTQQCSQTAKKYTTVAECEADSE